MTAGSGRCWVKHLGCRPYKPVWALQRRWAERRRHDQVPDTLFMVEHPPTFTAGRQARAKELLWSASERQRRGVSLFEVDRGGRTTYHGPGQLVGYPILKLEGKEKDVHAYLHRLEETLIRTLQRFGIEAGRDPEHTGVWCGGDKIAAIGVTFRRWVTYHGFALNVTTDLSFFEGIIPCGLPSRGVTSMAEQLGRHPTLTEVDKVYRDSFSKVFDRRLVPLPERSWPWPGKQTNRRQGRVESKRKRTAR